MYLIVYHEKGSEFNYQMRIRRGYTQINADIFNFVRVLLRQPRLLFPSLCSGL